jgi:hypothetical protein
VSGALGRRSRLSGSRGAARREDALERLEQPAARVVVPVVDERGDAGDERGVPVVDERFLGASGPEQQVEADRRLGGEAGEQLELCETERAIRCAVEHREHAEGALVVQER